MNKISTLEILLVSFLLLAPIIAGYLGLRVLKLNKRVKQVQADRNKLIEERNKLKLKELDTENNLSEIEKKMILNALCMPGYNLEMNNPETRHHVRKAYRELKKKIKESFSD